MGAGVKNLDVGRLWLTRGSGHDYNGDGGCRARGVVWRWG